MRATASWILLVTDQGYQSVTVGLNLATPTQGVLNFLLNKNVAP